MTCKVSFVDTLPLVMEHFEKIKITCSTHLSRGCFFFFLILIPVPVDTVDMNVVVISKTEGGEHSLLHCAALS